MTRSITANAIFALLLPLVTACGGGGGGSSDPNVVSPLTLTLADSHPNSGDAIALMADQAVSWQQLAGPSVVSMSWDEPVLAFDLPASGSYRFVATASDGHSTEISFEGSDSENAAVAIRRDRAQPGGSELSLRAFATPATSSGWQWLQVSGPTATLTSDGAVAFITLPRVTSNQTLRFRATTTIDGVDVSDEAVVIATPSPALVSNSFFPAPLTRVFPYRATSPYAPVLTACLYSNNSNQSCSLGRLPLLSNDRSAPSIDEILDRVVVSHSWMGDALRDFLENSDPYGDFRQLLGAVTGIVISSDIRPAYYWTATGAIYLDADYLWRNPDERDLINEQPDYRSGFGRDLAFDILWRYTKDNQYAFVRTPRSERQSRSDEELQAPLSFLLYHELAHANDFFPADLRAGLTSETTVLSAASQLANRRLSTQLRRDQPLASSLLTTLAQVSFFGAVSSDSQQALTPAEIAAEFANDGASDYYNYATQYEDLAMLFEELMMTSRLGVRRDVAVTNQPQLDQPSAADFVVEWGQRGRISQPGVRERALWVAEQILPDADPAALVNGLPAPDPLRSGESWLANLDLTPAPAARNIDGQSQMPTRDIDMVDDRLRPGLLRDQP